MLQYVIIILTKEEKATSKKVLVIVPNKNEPRTTRKEENMEKRTLNEIWKEQEGSRTLWKVQAQKGILTFRTKEAATAWVDSFKEAHKSINFKYIAIIDGEEHHLNIGQHETIARNTLESMLDNLIDTLESYGIDSDEILEQLLDDTGAEEEKGAL